MNISVLQLTDELGLMFYGAKDNLCLGKGDNLDQVSFLVKGDDVVVQSPFVGVIEIPASTLIDGWGRRPTLLVNELVEGVLYNYNFEAKQG